MVAFDAVGPAGGAGTAFTATPGTWTHVNGGNGILVGVTCFGGTANTVTGVTYGGVTIPFLGYIASGGAGVGPGGIALYGLTGGTCPTGSNTVSVAFSDATANHNAGSISVSGAGSLGTPVLGSATGVATVSVSVPGTTTGGLIVSAVCQGSSSAFSATSPNILRFTKLTSPGSGSDNIAGGTDPSTGGGASQTVTWTNVSTDEYGVIAVEVLPAGGAATSPQPPQQHRYRWRTARRPRPQVWQQPLPAPPLPPAVNQLLPPDIPMASANPRLLFAPWPAWPQNPTQPPVPQAVTFQGAASLAGTGSLSTAAIQGAGASLSAAGSLTAAAVQQAGTTLGGTGSLTAAGSVSSGAGAVLAGAGSLADAATELAFTQLAATGSLAGSSAQAAGTALAAAGSLTASAITHPPQIKGFSTAWSVTRPEQAFPAVSEAAAMASLVTGNGNKSSVTRGGTSSASVTQPALSTSGVS